MKDGPIEIEIMSEKDGTIKFRFVSFPKEARGKISPPSFRSYYEAIGIKRFFGPRVGSWEVGSDVHPAVHDRVLFLPGTNIDYDEKVLEWWDGKELLLNLINATRLVCAEMALEEGKE